jgi:lipopolysaccharide biosynthesis glycosyltransferase
LNLSICFDKNYQRWATVCLHSVIEHYRGSNTIRLVIISDIEYCNCIPQLKKVLKSFDYTFDNPGSKFNSLPTGYHFNETTYWRLALPKVLVKYGIERAIYIDTDTLVVDNIGTLYNTELDGATLGACLDIGTIKHVNRMSLSQGFAINGGVLLMDIQKMNAIDWISEANRLNDEGLIQWVDQDVLNILLDGQIKLIDLKWNMQTGHFLNKYNIKPSIVHFTMWASKKPWFTTFKHPFIPVLLKILWKYKFMNEFIRIGTRFVWNKISKKSSKFLKRFGNLKY